MVILGFNGAGKTTLLRMLAGVDQPDREVIAGHGLKLGYYAQEHETLDTDALRVGEHEDRGTGPGGHRGAQRPRSFLFQGDDVAKPAGVLSGGEKTRLALATLVASSANVLLLTSRRTTWTRPHVGRSSTPCAPTRVPWCS
ncbi:ATP-binding cassette domain-containing protein [Citricoccus parietis]|uniref:ATP-binding cassette domain-containing protein n=1 Tax=Citricoccus parietis TaxID=592307 RepID=A0ABV5FSM6_9MICC